MAPEAQATLQHGLTAHRSGDLAGAEAAYRSVLAVSPAHPEALQLLGLVSFGLRRFADAASAFERALSLDPDEPTIRFNLGKSYEALGRSDDAVAAYAAIPPSAPEAVEAIVRIGVIAYAQERLPAAAAAFERALRISPRRHLTAALNLGIVYGELGRFADAVMVLGAVCAVAPDDSDARRALADAYRAEGRTYDAFAQCRRLLTADPNDVNALIVLGRTHYDTGDYDEADRVFASAAELAPGRHEPLRNRSVVAHSRGDLPKAIAFGEAAVALAPDDRETRLNLGMSYLMAGDVERGRPLFESRLGEANASALPRWRGGPFAGSVLVTRDQGVGDFLLFSRYLPHAREHVGRLVVEVPPELAELYAGFPGIDELVPGPHATANDVLADAAVPLASLPYALGAPAAPPPMPLLVADPERRERFAERISRRPGTFRIGIVWAGSAGHGSDRYRSCGLPAFAALADLPDIAWVSLQKGPRERDVRDAPRGLAPLDLAPQLSNFSDTAAAIAELDLVISVDTSVAHLAGALGVPVWTLLGFETYWIWGPSGTETPWYPSMRLFRQHTPNDWTGVFADVRSALLAK